MFQIFILLKACFWKETEENFGKYLDPFFLFYFFSYLFILFSYFEKSPTEFQIFFNFEFFQQFLLGQKPRFSLQTSGPEVEIKLSIFWT